MVDSFTNNPFQKFRVTSLASYASHSIKGFSSLSSLVSCIDKSFEHPAKVCAERKSFIPEIEARPDEGGNAAASKGRLTLSKAPSMGKLYTTKDELLLPKHSAQQCSFSRSTNTVA